MVYSFHKLSQPILVIDKHRGSEMFATLSLHRLAINLSFLMSLNILLLLILPYVFYICNDDVACDEWTSHNATNVIKVDGDNYVQGIFQNLQLQADDEPPNVVHSSQSPMSSQSHKNVAGLKSTASHFQLPFFYGYFRLDVLSADVASNNVANKKLYKSNADSQPTYDYAFVEEETDVRDEFEDLSIMRDIYRRHLALIYVCVVFVSVVGLAIYFFRQFIWLVKGVIYDQTADTW